MWATDRRSTEAYLSYKLTNQVRAKTRGANASDFVRGKFMKKKVLCEN